MKWPFSKSVVQAKQFPSLPMPLEWGQNDVLALRAFRDSGTGQKLFEIARAKVLEHGVANAADVFHTQHSAGVTTGMDNMLKYLWNMASDEILKRFQDDAPAKASNNTGTDERESDPAFKRAYN